MRYQEMIFKPWGRNRCSLCVVINRMNVTPGEAEALLGLGDFTPAKAWHAGKVGRWW